jgi:hypothetical protein
MTGNRELAAQARQLADRELRGSAARASALCAAVALGQTSTIPAARKVLAGWNGTAHIRDGALRVLDEVAGAGQ